MVRERVVERLRFLGDFEVAIVPSREELVIAAETRRLLDAYGGVARPGRMLAHSDWIFLVDGENRVREIYSERLFNPERALADIASLTATARPR